MGWVNIAESETNIWGKITGGEFISRRRMVDVDRMCKRRSREKMKSINIIK